MIELKLIWSDRVDCKSMTTTDDGDDTLTLKLHPFSIPEYNLTGKKLILMVCEEIESQNTQEGKETRVVNSPEGRQ